MSAAAWGNHTTMRRTLSTASVILASFLSTCRISTMSCVKWVEKSAKDGYKTERDGETDLVG